MATGACSAHSSLQANSKVKFAAWPTIWRPPGTDRFWPIGNTVNSRIWLAPYINDSTVNIVVVIIVIIIIKAVADSWGMGRPPNGSQFFNKLPFPYKNIGERGKRGKKSCARNGRKETGGCSGGSTNFEKGGRNTIYQSRRHLSQMHRTKCTPFTRKKAAFKNKY